jgi:dTMP kinase
LVFVVIDGLDASGKTTQAFELSNLIRHQGKTVFLRFHPSGDNAFGIVAKQFLYSNGKKAHFAAALFYLIDVFRSILLYAWRRYDYLIFVRYLIGTAYLPIPLSRIAYRILALFVPTSDQMFFLDVTPSEADRRLRATRQRFEMFENLEGLIQTRDKAISLASAGKWTIINANESVKQVQEKIRESLRVTLPAS